MVLIMYFVLWERWLFWPVRICVFFVVTNFEQCAGKMLHTNIWKMPVYHCEMLGRNSEQCFLFRHMKLNTTLHWLMNHSHRQQTTQRPFSCKNFIVCLMFSFYTFTHNSRKVRSCGLGDSFHWYHTATGAREQVHVHIQTVTTWLFAAWL